ncbi:MAG: AbrB/MazE/SpoVT family DNA-binding domain-containing protein [Propionibacteriaceae bacterium]|jgi:AbrB family looped-hinge helix DNA binding protein|nr:AbrB/MazE/SpoVT family DNA-binding domain-containing protein [Propionibacteriaceae bacterium]
MLNVTIGDRGRLVIPAEIRQKYDWPEGTTLTIQTIAGGIELLAPSEALRRFQASVIGTPSPVDELINERHSVAALGD